jgi:hypothetical protein
MVRDIPKNAKVELIYNRVLSPLFLLGFTHYWANIEKWLKIEQGFKLYIFGYYLESYVVWNSLTSSH